MDAGLEAELSPPLRLALAWAPRHARPATLALFALDTRLAGFLRRATEPLPVQMRLAWWRDTLGAPPCGQALDREAITGFALGREQAWSALAREVGASRAEPGAAARAWSLADLAANLSAPEERRRVIEAAGPLHFALPGERALRPLAVLGGLGRRALRRGGLPLLDGRTAALVALRLGMLGR